MIHITLEDATVFKDPTDEWFKALSRTLFSLFGPGSLELFCLQITILELQVIFAVSAALDHPAGKSFNDCHFIL